MAEFIDIHKKDKYLSNKKKKIEADKELSQRNNKIILDYLRDSELGKTIKKGQKKKIGSGRNLQVAGFLNQMAAMWFKKDLDKVGIKEMERFILDLEHGKIKSRHGKPFKSEYKKNIKKFIKKFYKHILGNGTHYPPLVDWIDTSGEQSQIQAVPGLYQGVWKIVEVIPDIRRKALVWTAFDSGFRQGELINCRIKDVEKVDDTFYISCKHSKTKPRTVSLPHATELLQRWLNEHPKKDDPNAQLWQTSRIMFYKTVKLYGKKIHKCNVTVHMLRHTSATYYAPKLDRVTFCKRYGWSYNSQSPDRYIDFAKVSESKVADIIEGEKFGELKRELDKEKEQNKLLQDKVNGLMKDQHNTTELIAMVMNKVDDLKKASKKKGKT